MKKIYIEKKLPVQADVWDGSKENMKALQLDFSLQHNAVAYNEDGTVQSWSITINQQRVPVQPGYYIVKNDVAGDLNVMTADAFQAKYEISAQQ
jgi:hypothetical protein